MGCVWGVSGRFWPFAIPTRAGSARREVSSPSVSCVVQSPHFALVYDSVRFFLCCLEAVGFLAVVGVSATAASKVEATIRRVASCKR